MVGLPGGVSEIHGTPFDIEDTVGRSARNRRVNAAGAARIPRAASPTQIICAQVIPVREHSVIVSEPRQANVGKGRIRGRELRIAVGGQINAGEGLIVQRVREGQRNGGHRIIPVIADVGRAWHDATAYLIYHVRANARRGR